jgi:hypothetical protein
MRIASRWHAPVLEGSHGGEGSLTPLQGEEEKLNHAGKKCITSTFSKGAIASKQK